MLKNEERRNIPEVKFNFEIDKKPESERKKEIEKLLKKRNEIFASMGLPIPDSNVLKANEASSEHLSQYRDKEIDEKMEAGIIGFAVGDALGVPVEFLDRNSLQKHPLKEMIGFGSHDVPEGTWSDDTSLMVATMDSIIENECVNFEDIMYKFTEWMNYAKYTATDRLFDIGISTSKAISNFKNGQIAINCGTKGINENGNGSLMRILPFVYCLKYFNLPEEKENLLINQASSLTHAHEISRLGCKIYSDYITLLLDGVNKVEALDMLRENDYGKYYSNDSLNAYNRILNGDLKNANINQIKSTGYVVHSLEASLWCTIKNDTFEDAVVAAVNLGNDTDTIGAITGSINGIIYGKDKIPERWLNKLRKKDYLEELSRKFINTINHNGRSKNL